MSWYSRVKKKVVFFTGDIHLLHSFPWVTWSIHRHYVDLGEIQEGMSEISHGDIGIHRDWGYLSNKFIPGFMKHGWIHVEDNYLNNPMIVEAVSEGVVCRSAYYPMYSDYTIILSPKGVTDKDRRGACLKAKKIVGVEYDYDFKFDIDSEIKYYQGQNTDEALNDLKIAGENLSDGYDTKFSCTEVCAYSWWHQREKLNIKRKKFKNKLGQSMDIIAADDFLNDAWEIKWMSASVDPDSSKKYRLHEAGMDIIADFRRQNPVKMRVWTNLGESGASQAEKLKKQEENAEAEKPEQSSESV